jgi:hypothetical protein
VSSFLIKRKELDMNCYSTRVISLLTILAVILLSSHLGAPAHAGEMVRLKGNFTCQSDLPTSESFCQGQATQVGQNETFVDGNGAATWVTPNGDTITNITWFFEIGDEVSTGVFLFIQEIQFTGGTGRFSNAVGSATLTGTWNFLTGEIVGFIDGTISRPNWGR